MRQFWTPDEHDRLRELYPKLPVPQLAAQFPHRTIKALYQAAAKLGLSGPRKCWPAALLDQVRELHAEGLVDPAIGAKLGLTRDQVHAIRYGRLDLPANQAGIRDAQRRAIASQCKTLGIETGGELRKLGFANYAVRNGWAPLRERRFRYTSITSKRTATSRPGRRVGSITSARRGTRPRTRSRRSPATTPRNCSPSWRCFCA